jgi:hypothetical protein
MSSGDRVAVFIFFTFGLGYGMSITGSTSKVKLFLAGGKNKFEDRSPQI